MKLALPIAAVLVAALPSVAAAADEEQNHRNLADALKSGRFGIDLRYRWEKTSDDAFELDAVASTLRTALGYRSARFYQFAVMLEFEDVSDLGSGDRHDNGGAGSLSNGVTDRPLIPDPKGTEVNQVVLRYHGLQQTELVGGRQEINLGNQRFVGAVGWRQNRQSFDAFRVEQGSLPRTKLTYAYLANANSVTGADRRQDSHLLQAAVEAGDRGTLTPYLYRIDFDSASNAAFSTRTIGASWEGRAAAGGWKLPYRLEYARQDDVGDNPGQVDAGYLHVALKAQRERLVLTAGLEVLEGSEEDGRFTTPLATLHKFNGWADKFALTPVNGLKDLYVSAGLDGSRISAVLVYHDFDAESSGPDHGSEVDCLVSYRMRAGPSFSLSFARFDADSAGSYTDADKFWAYTGYRF